MSAYPKRIVRRSTVLTSASFTNSEIAVAAVQYQGGDLVGPLVVGVARCKRKSGATNDIIVRGYNDSSKTVELFEQTFAGLVDEDTSSTAFTFPLPLEAGETLHVTFENGAPDASTAQVTIDFEVTA